LPGESFSCRQAGEVVLAAVSPYIVGLVARDDDGRPGRMIGTGTAIRFRTSSMVLIADHVLRNSVPEDSLGLQGFEQPEAGSLALRQYNERSANMLDEMADRLEGRVYEPMPESETDDQFVEQVLAACGCEPREFPPHMRSFVILLRRTDGVTRALAEEVRLA
jgi:hypothetical protein